VFADGEIMRGVAGTSKYLGIGEGNIHAPVQSVLDRPVRANCLKQSVGIGGQAADVEALLDG
jgi:hypothetical protein